MLDFFLKKKREKKDFDAAAINEKAEMTEKDPTRITTKIKYLNEWMNE